MKDDDDDDLFRRFAALRAPSAGDLPSCSIMEVSHQATIDKQARKAALEDDELDAIANGRAIRFPPTLQNLALRDDEDLKRRFGELRGREEDGGDDTEMGDDEVFFYQPEWMYAY